jgi:proteasome lid subunit RPN8/RPN11
LLAITPEAVRIVIADAEKAYPHEGCGIFVGRRRGDDFEVVRAVPAANENTDKPRVWYDLAPADQERIEREARRDGLDVIGYYHSHPDHPARPSEGDRSRAFGSYVYVIAAVAAGRYQEMTAWTLDDDMAFPEHTARFLSVPIRT